MATFTATFFPLGAHVKVVGGKYDGCTGTVVGWGHIGHTTEEQTQHVVFDVPYVDPWGIKEDRAEFRASELVET